MKISTYTQNIIIIVNSKYASQLFLKEFIHTNTTQNYVYTEVHGLFNKFMWKLNKNKVSLEEDSSILQYNSRSLKIQHLKYSGF